MKTFQLTKYYMNIFQLSEYNMFNLQDLVDSILCRHMGVPGVSRPGGSSESYIYICTSSFLHQYIYPGRLYK